MSEVSSTSKSAKPFWKRNLPWLAAAGTFATLAAVYVGGYLYVGDRLPSNATIAGVEVGGLSPDAAAETLIAGVADRADQPITLVHDEQTLEFLPEAIGLELDVDESVAQAGGERSWNPIKIVDYFTGGSDHPPVLQVDESALDTAVESIGESVNQPVVEALIEFPDATPVATEPEAGLEIDPEETGQSLIDAYLQTTEPIELEPQAVEPQVDAEGLREAMTTIAEPAMAGPVTVNAGEATVELPVTAFAPALTVEVVDGEMQPVIDAEALAEPLRDSVTGIGEQAVDAQIRFEGGRPVIIPSENGIGLDPEEVATELVGVVTESGETRAITVEATVVEPEFTTEDAEALGINERISTYTTNYPHAEYRNINQGRAAEILNNTLIKPGETFSFNDTVGRRTEANGFTSGIVINQGVFREEMGGGVSQVVTTTYNAGFFAGLEDVEHHPHAFYIDRYPVGREATVYFGSLDLRIRNQFDTGVLIRAFVNRSTPGTQGSITVEMWGTKVYDIEAGQSERRNHRAPGTRYDATPQCVSQSPVAGFDIDIYRHFNQNGQRIRTETTTANYQAADRVICGPQP